MFLIKKHPLYAAIIFSGILLSVISVVTAFVLPEGYFIIGTVEWGKEAIIWLTMATLGMFLFNCFLSCRLFYRDRFLSYAIIFLSLFLIFMVFLKVAFFNILW